MRQWLLTTLPNGLRLNRFPPKITSGKVLQFVIKNIVTRFGIPNKIVSDNGTQFENEEFSRFCYNNGIIKSFSSIAHPKANGAVEAANKKIKTILKKRLNKAKGKWVEELPLVLWAYRTSTKTATGHTPYSLTYRCVAMLPVEVEVPSHQRIAYAFDPNQELREESLDLIHGLRNEAAIRTAEYQRWMSKYYNSKVKPRTFGEGDLVLRRVLANTKDPADGMLGPNWEGPLVIHKEIPPGTYRLCRPDGNLVPRTWNAEHLRHYFPSMKN